MKNIRKESMTRLLFISVICIFLLSSFSFAQTDERDQDERSGVFASAPTKTTTQTMSSASASIVTFRPGWNDFSLTAQPIITITASELCQKVPACMAVVYLDENSQKWVFNYLETPEQNNFVLKAGVIYSVVIDKNKYTGASTLDTSGLFSRYAYPFGGGLVTSTSGSAGQQCHEFNLNAQWAAYCQQLDGTIEIITDENGCATGAKCKTECSESHCEFCAEEECGSGNTSGYCKPIYANFSENGQIMEKYAGCLKIETKQPVQKESEQEGCVEWQPDTGWVIQCSNAGGVIKLIKGSDRCIEKAQCVVPCSKTICSGCTELECGSGDTTGSCKPLYANFMEDNKITKRFVACVQTQMLGNTLGASSSIKCTTDSECAGSVCSEGDTKCIDSYCTCVPDSGVDPLVTASKKLDEVKKNLQKMELMAGAIRDYLKNTNDSRVQIWSSIHETIKTDIQKATELQDSIREENANPTQTGRNMIRLQANQLASDIDNIMTLMMS